MIKRNYHYELKAKPLDKNVNLKDFEKYFNNIKKTFNAKDVANPKEIDSIKMSDAEDEDNVIIIDLYTEEPLSEGRELQGVRRVSEALAGYDKTIVVPKNHVLISA